MNPKRATALALVLIVVLAGCASLANQASQSEDGAPDTPGGTATGTVTDTATRTATSTPTPTPTPTATWSPPNTPLQPTEDKTEPDRIKEVRFVDTVPAADGTGVSDFDIEVRADTRMPDVDPDSDGEPYFIVEINGVLVERTGIKPFEANGTFRINVRQAGLQQFEPGTLNVRVTMMEEDSHYADWYGSWNGTVEYDPSAAPSAGTTTASTAP